MGKNRNVMKWNNFRVRVWWNIFLIVFKSDVGWGGLYNLWLDIYKKCILNLKYRILYKLNMFENKVIEIL